MYVLLLIAFVADRSSHKKLLRICFDIVTFNSLLLVCAFVPFTRQSSHLALPFTQIAHTQEIYTHVCTI